MIVIQKKFLFTHDVNIDVPFITALGVAYNHLGKMRKSVFRSWVFWSEVERHPFTL